MDYLIAIFMGFLQGVTEFIPVSSTGHLLLAETFLGDLVDFSGFEFDVLLNIGTLLALVIHFRVKLVSIIKDAFFGGGDKKLVRNIIITTIPAAVLGFLFKDIFANYLRGVWVLAFMLALGGVVMLFEHKIGNSKKKVNDLSKKDALSVGLFQVLALIAGTSRSGVTIIAGKIQGLSSKEAAEYSFLIAIPIVIGAVLRVMVSSQGQETLSQNLGPIIVGNISSFVFGYIAIRFMLAYIAKSGLKVFGYYRLGLATLVLLSQFIK